MSPAGPGVARTGPVCFMPPADCRHNASPFRLVIGKAPTLGGRSRSGSGQGGRPRFRGLASRPASVVPAVSAGSGFQSSSSAWCPPIVLETKSAPGKPAGARTAVLWVCGARPKAHAHDMPEFGTCPSRLAPRFRGCPRHCSYSISLNGRVITPILPQHLSTVNACCEVRAGVYILPTISYVLLPFPR